MKIRYILYMFLCILLLSACSGNQPTEHKLSSFSFIDQNERPFGTEDLDGKVWIASFIFTNCETVCPPMMFKMASLQNKLEEKGLDVEFVSFTVDPELDTTDVLKEYLAEFTDKETNWRLLTGYSQKDIERFAREEFQTIVQKPENSTQVIHGTNFYLVDDQGYVIEEYNYIEASYADDIIKKVKEMNR